MDKEEIKDIVQNAISESLIPVFAKMLSDSEKRIDQTNNMICKLSEVVENFDRHITNLESSRDLCSSNAANLIEANRDLTRVIEQIRGDYRDIISDFKTELLSAKEMYRRASESYIRLAEMNHASSKGNSRTEVKISSDNVR